MVFFKEPERRKDSVQHTGKFIINPTQTKVYVDTDGTSCERFLLCSSVSGPSISLINSSSLFACWTISFNSFMSSLKYGKPPVSELIPQMLVISL